jgi:uncharacterized protein YbaR (Trm112 family)
MPSADLLTFLVCPENRSPLTVADESLLGELNAAARAGLLKNRAGQTVEFPLEGALVRADRTVAYPVVDRIPLMLVDEGIPLSQFSASQGAGQKS